MPAIIIASDLDGAAVHGKGYPKNFSGKYSHQILKDIGHNVRQEDPQSFAQAIIEVDRF